MKLRVAALSCGAFSFCIFTSNVNFFKELKYFKNRIDLINSLGQGWLQFQPETDIDEFRQQVLQYTTQQTMLNVNQVKIGKLIKYCMLYNCNSIIDFLS